MVYPLYLNQMMTKPTKSPAHPVKTQINLRLCPVFTFYLKKVWVVSYPFSTLINLGRCAGWSQSYVGTHVILLVLSYGGAVSQIWEKAISSVQNILYRKKKNPHAGKRIQIKLENVKSKLLYWSFDLLKSILHEPFRLTSCICKVWEGYWIYKILESMKPTFMRYLSYFHVKKNSINMLSAFPYSY